jgi:hypothetical protein
MPACGEGRLSTKGVLVNMLFRETGHNLEEQAGYVYAFLRFIDENK